MFVLTGGSLVPHSVLKERSVSVIQTETISDVQAENTL